MMVVAEQRLKAALLAMAAVGVASAQDAIVKSLVGAMPAYETVLLRGLVGGPLLAALLVLTDGFRALATPLLWPLMVRGLVLCTAYFAFILSIAAMPIANAVAIYFTMPFFVAAFAGPFLGERVPLYRWLAIAAAFVGVIVMVRPGATSFEPASFLALYSAFGYAVGQMMGRHYSQKVPPVAIANVQNAAYLVVAFVLFLLFNGLDIHFTGHKSLVFLSAPWVTPTWHDAMLLAVMGVFATMATVMFTYAYKLAQSSFVAPFEYTAMIWAVIYGLVLFGDFPAAATWLGMAIVITAGLFMMWRDARHRIG